MDEKRTTTTSRIPGSKEFVTIKSHEISFKKPLEGHLKNKSDQGLGIAFPTDTDPDAESLEENKLYEINLHFTHEAIDETLDPFIRREEGLYVFTFSAVCKHITPHPDENIIVAGFVLDGSIPMPILEFLRKKLPELNL